MLDTHTRASDRANVNSVGHQDETNVDKWSCLIGLETVPCFPFCLGPALTDDEVELEATGVENGEERIVAEKGMEG